MEKLRKSFVAYVLLVLGAVSFACCSSSDDDNENGGGSDGSESSSKVAKAIDLGLPSGTKWADRNVGADSPEDYGDYFAWGETSPKESYTNGNSVTYNQSISELKSKGIIDSDGNLTSAHDAAAVNWGKSWKTPTVTQIQELVTNCTWKKKSKNGIEGYEVKSKKNDNSIFLPAAGYRFDSSLTYEGLSGYYWNSTAYGVNTYYLHFNSGSYSCGGYYQNRYLGFSVRPVSE